MLISDRKDYDIAFVNQIGYLHSTSAREMSAAWLSDSNEIST